MSFSLFDLDCALEAGDWEPTGLTLDQLVADDLKNYKGGRVTALLRTTPATKTAAAVAAPAAVPGFSHGLGACHE